MSPDSVQSRLILGNIRLGADQQLDDALSVARNRMKITGIPLGALSFRLHRRSVDARHRDRVSLVCSVIVESTQGADLCALSPSVLAAIDAKPLREEPLALQKRGTQPMKYRPMVVGMGPAGLFCALLLAENGYRPILIDRGDAVEDRVRAVERFHTFGILDTDSNIQFGAGGAGTFSDGKLLTRISDPRCAWVLRRLHEFGAPDDILYKAKPHVGTDVLRVVIHRLLSRIEELGGQLHYRTRLDDVRENADGSYSVKTNRGEMVCSALVLALGHSARDTYRMLIEKNFDIIPKPISVGVRIEHLQEDIDRALYGNFAGNHALGPAEYALSDTKGERGVYTFCMCPGGEVVAAASEEGGLVVNGMSHHARDGKNANCAVAVSVRCEDYEPEDGNAALGAIAYQRMIERAAFMAGGGAYAAPIQTVGDFMRDQLRHVPTRVHPTYRGGTQVKMAALSSVFPSYITEHLRYGLSAFDRKIHGFAADDAVLSAAETRTSAPVRILRGDDLCAIGHKAIYPCGEGAGYAGGITSAAVDGLRVAMTMIERFAPSEC
ncbi:MAG: NAD(P)/FAD-dependent oxidoreductase [Clostridia bacterium]|nr:NAD(P)/FAD-dependent oxidoreductase [Clostridia bacterium]